MMPDRFTPPRLLVWITLAVMLIASITVIMMTRSQLPEGIVINVKGQPTIGYPKAKVHVVVFEEPKCSNCRDFTSQIFPKIKEEFIDTNKIMYTVVPVAFLPHSMPAAIALLCVYYADPMYPNSDLFFTYMDYMYKHQPDEHTDWASIDRLLHFAEGASPAINLQQLKKCASLETYRVKIEKNTEYGRSIMNGMLMTPSVYVNGIEVKEITYEEISRLIKEVLEHEGVQN